MIILPALKVPYGSYNPSTGSVSVPLVLRRFGSGPKCPEGLQKNPKGLLAVTVAIFECFVSSMMLEIFWVLEAHLKSP